MKNSELINCLYPNKCAACNEIIPDGKIFCEYCASNILNIDHKNFCTKCGLEKEFCRCKYREFHFTAVACVYKNSGIARDAYYAYKIGRREELAPFFARQAFKVVRHYFRSVEFDAVVSVPTVLSSRLKRGFDHSKLIAERLAYKLNVPYISNVLKVRPFMPLQHKSTFAQRLENVRGKYYTVNRLRAKKVLLFDDIYTTAATLDECAKELLFAGAREVYCVAILSTNLKKKNTEIINNGK